MNNVHTFTPRRPAVASTTPPAPSPAEIRREIEQALQSALNTVDLLVGILNLIDGDASEMGVASTDTLAVPEPLASPVIWLRGTVSDREQDSAR